jgi:site-specific recombinase XerD
MAFNCQSDPGVAENKPASGSDLGTVAEPSGQAMTRSNVTQRLTIAVRAAAKNNAQLTQRPISPHTIRHATAMHLPQSGVDISVIARWLGHESPTTTHNYVEADLAMKDRALARLQEPKTKMRRYRAPNSLLEFLHGL